MSDHQILLSAFESYLVAVLTVLFVGVGVFIAVAVSMFRGGDR